MKLQKHFLSNIVSIKTGKLNSNASVINGIYPFYTCSKEIYKTNSFSFDTEAVLLGGNNAIGDYPLFYFKGQFDAYQRTYIIEPLNEDLVDTRYLFYDFRLKLNSLKNSSTGTSTKFLTLKILNKIEVSLPTLNVQRKIASILSAYDDLIENNLRRIKLLEEAANFHYSLLWDPNSICETKTVKLKDIYNTSSGGTPSRKRPDYFYGDVNWFKSKELNDSILLKSEERITKAAISESSAKIFPSCSVIIAMYGATIGKLGILSEDSTTNQACCAIIPKNTLYSEFFIFFWLLKNKEHILGFRMGAAQQNISQEVIKNLDIKLPDPEQLSIFNHTCKVIFEMIKNLQKQNIQLHKIRDILLPKLMSGEIEV